jgi:hypothetical protein
MNLRSVIKAGIAVNRDELSAAELYALLVIEEESLAYEKEISERKR